MASRLFNKIYSFFLSEKRRIQFEKIVFLAAIVAFVVHFVAIILANSGYFSNQMFGIADYQNPITAIYTPFSIIILYEIYALIYYLPRSITIYLGKQYEIIALIMLRKIFSYLANLPIGTNVTGYENIKVLSLTFVGLLILLILIFCFYKLAGNKAVRNSIYECRNRKEKIFFISKKFMSFGLFLLFIILFIRSMLDLRQMSFTVQGIVDALKTVNETFFFSFFTALILVEVLLLLFTFNLSQNFSKVIRNSGFIISTILLKLSFRTTGVENILIVLMAVVFGVAILAIYRLFEKKLYPQEKSTSGRKEEKQSMSE